MVIASFAYASPCNGVSRHLSAKTRAALAPVIAKQLDVPVVDVLQSFRLGHWRVIYVDTHQADEAFLFFSGDPIVSHYVTIWSGAATKSEEKGIKEWVLKNAPGIPRQLAICFAWHVTTERDM